MRRPQPAWAGKAGGTPANSCSYCRQFKLNCIIYTYTYMYYAMILYYTIIWYNIQWHTILWYDIIYTGVGVSRCGPHREARSDAMKSLRRTSFEGHFTHEANLRGKNPRNWESQARDLPGGILIPVSVKETLLLQKPPPCNAASQTALKPLIRCSERSSSHMSSSPEERFSQTPVPTSI